MEWSAGPAGISGSDHAWAADNATGAVGVSAVADGLPANAALGSTPRSVADQARRHVRTIREQLALLAELPLERLSGDEMLGIVREVEAVARSAFGAQVRVAAEIEERALAETYDARSAAHLLHETLNVTIGEARARLEAARVGLGRETITGETIAPSMPALVAAIDAGAISGGHARVITRCLAKIPRSVDEETVETCRHTLLDQARQRDVNGLQKVADQILSIVIEDGDLWDPPEDRAELYIGARRGDGLTPIRGMLSPLVAEQMRVAVEALAAPRPIDEATPDPRSAPLRREQALGEILHRHLTSGAGPRDGGVRPQVVVTIGLADLFASTVAGTGDNGTPAPSGTGAAAASRSATAEPVGIGPSGPAAAVSRAARPGAAWSDYDGPQSAGLARLLACDAQIIPQVLGGESVVLDQGRGQRLFTAVQRRALTTRDKGCAFPGCDIPPAWCEAHHIIWWKRDGGPTDAANGVLLCRRHHVLIHQERWRIQQDSGGARPWFVPPPHIDPTRRPRRNCHFHLSALASARRRE